MRKENPMRNIVLPIFSAVLLSLTACGGQGDDSLGDNAADAAEKYFVHSFERRQLTDQFTCEGATAGDIDRDGHPDLIAGPYWYAGPEFPARALGHSTVTDFAKFLG